MDYFNDIYLKRTNRFGDNIQDRVHGQMEYDFENKLKKSVNRVTLFDKQDNDKQIGIGILETKKIDEKQTINYLCTRISDDYKNGFVFYSCKPFDTKKQSWMILFKEQYQTIGYNRYKVILLNNSIEWIQDGIMYKSPVHYIGSLESAIKDEFKINYDVVAGVPSKLLTLICPSSSALKRNTKINIEDETWRVTNIDKISIKGVMYATLEEDYIEKTQYANQEELNKWSIISSQGHEIVITNGMPAIDFYTSFDGTSVDEEVVITTENNDLIITKNNNNNNFSFTSNKDVKATITVSLKRAPLVTQLFSIMVSSQQENWLSVIGPKQIKVLETLEFRISSSIQEGEVTISSERGHFEKIKEEDNKVYLRGTSIGEDNILLEYNGVTYPTPLKVISPWM